LSLYNLLVTDPLPTFIPTEKKSEPLTVLPHAHGHGISSFLSELCLRTAVPRRRWLGAIPFFPLARAGPSHGRRICPIPVPSGRLPKVLFSPRAAPRFFSRIWKICAPPFEGPPHNCEILAPPSSHRLCCHSFGCPTPLPPPRRCHFFLCPIHLLPPPPPPCPQARVGHRRDRNGTLFSQFPFPSRFPGNGGRQGLFPAGNAGSHRRATLIFDFC